MKKRKRFQKCLDRSYCVLLAVGLPSNLIVFECGLVASHDPLLPLFCCSPSFQFFPLCIGVELFVLFLSFGPCWQLCRVMFFVKIWLATVACSPFSFFILLPLFLGVTVCGFSFVVCRTLALPSSYPNFLPVFWLVLGSQGGGLLLAAVCVLAGSFTLLRCVAYLSVPIVAKWVNLVL